MKIEKLTCASTLWHYGIRFVVVTKDTEELIAAFCRSEDADHYLEWHGI